MLASRVTFLPQLRGVLPKALAPLRDQAYSGESETLAPISSTNTRRSASTFPATSILQAALRNSSRSPAPSDLFSAPPEAPHHPAHGRVADRETGHPPEVLATLGEGGGGAFFEVRFQHPPGALVHLGL